MRPSRLRMPLVRLWMMSWILGSSLISAAQEAPPAKKSPAADSAALLPFAELLKKQGHADGVVLAQVTELNNTRQGTWGTCGVFVITGLAVFETLATVTGTSPGPRFVLSQKCPGFDLIRPGKHLVAWQKAPAPESVDLTSKLKQAIAGLPTLSGEYYAFDGVVIAAPQAQAQSQCPQPLPKRKTWVDYQMVSVAVGDSPAAPFALALPCPVASGPLPILWRRDAQLGLGFFSLPPYWDGSAPRIPFLFPKHQR